jgi:hypothetical protein
MRNSEMVKAIEIDITFFNCAMFWDEPPRTYMFTDVKEEQIASILIMTRSSSFLRNACEKKFTVIQRSIHRFMVYFLRSHPWKKLKSNNVDFSMREKCLWTRSLLLQCEAISLEIALVYERLRRAAYFRMYRSINYLSWIDLATAIR